MSLPVQPKRRGARVHDLIKRPRAKPPMGTFFKPSVASLARNGPDHPRGHVQQDEQS
jgi:hypothetical protein